MSTLPSTGGFRRIKDQTETEDVSPPTWPSESVAFGFLIATGLICFIFIGSGLGVLLWRGIKDRGHENKTILATNLANSKSNTLDDDRILYWPVLTGIV